MLIYNEVAVVTGARADLGDIAFGGRFGCSFTAMMRPIVQP